MPVPDRVHYWSASEWNAMRDAIVEIGARMGLGDGSIAGSLESVAHDPASAARLFEDFLALGPPAGWTTIAGGTTVAFAGPADAALADGRTLGVQRITSTAGAQTGVVHHTTAVICGAASSLIVMRAKARLKAASAEFGFVPIADVSTLTFGISIRKNGAGWSVRSSSSLGTSASSTFGVSDSLWHLWEFRVQVGVRLDVYLDGALAVSIAITTAIPGSYAEPLAPMLRLRATVGAAEVAEADFFEAFMPRVTT
jgi:hypothetical protein